MYHLYIYIYIYTVYWMSVGPYVNTFALRKSASTWQGLLGPYFTLTGMTYICDEKTTKGAAIVFVEQ